MNIIGSLITLLENYEKSIIKVVLINFAPTYLVAYLFFHQLRDIDIFISIILIFGASSLLSFLFYFLVYVVYRRQSPVVTIALSSMYSAITIFLGSLNEFKILTLYIGILTTIATMLILRLILKNELKEVADHNIEETEE